MLIPDMDYDADDESSDLEMVADRNGDQNADRDEDTTSESEDEQDDSSHDDSGIDYGEETDFEPPVSCEKVVVKVEYRVPQERTRPNGETTCNVVTFKFVDVPFMKEEDLKKSYIEYFKSRYISRYVAKYLLDNTTPTCAVRRILFCGKSELDETED